MYMGPWASLVILVALGAIDSGSNPGGPTNVLFQILIGVGGNHFLSTFFPPE